MYTTYSTRWNIITDACVLYIHDFVWMLCRLLIPSLYIHNIRRRDWIMCTILGIFISILILSLRCGGAICSDGFTSYDNRCFLYNNKESSWSEADLVGRIKDAWLARWRLWSLWTMKQDRERVASPIFQMNIPHVNQRKQRNATIYQSSLTMPFWRMLRCIAPLSC